jgi:alkanesulfonate monooxygenase SsuD/methylene tetrahydromethanopterin reductase-like flavin-dependent oxidoreductase (luciferase family)
MRAGIYMPNGVQGEFAGWDPRRAWERSLQIGELGERLGFDAVWVPDHLQNIRRHDDAPTFESFILLAALAGRTQRVRLGQGVICAGFRSPALLAKMAATLDVASGGRAELAIGAGWNEWEYAGFGFAFPPVRERLKLMEETLEVVTRAFAPGRTTWHGDQVQVDDLILEPKGLHPARMRIIVGGNGPKVTWRLAARYADELNLDGPEVGDVGSWMPRIRQRCEEIGRDPETMPVSALIWWRGATGQPRVEGLQQLAALGLACVHSDFSEAVDSDEPIQAFAEDCRAAGVELRS